MLTVLISSLRKSLAECSSRNPTQISSYSTGDFFKVECNTELAYYADLCYTYHEQIKDDLNKVWDYEVELHDELEEGRKTQGAWKIIGGVCLVVAGVVCIVATAGAATPIVVAGAVAGGGTVAFGVAEMCEGGMASKGTAELCEKWGLDPNVTQAVSMVSGMVASGATAKGMTKLDTKFNISGMYPKGYSEGIKKFIYSDEEIEIYKKAGLKEVEIDGRKCLVRDIDLDYVDPILA